MTATVFLYVALFTALIAAAAAAAEWGVQGRIPARHFWSTAIVLALTVPPLAMAVHTWQGTRIAHSLRGEFVTIAYDAAGAHVSAPIARALADEAFADALVRRARVVAHWIAPYVPARMLDVVLVIWVVVSLSLLGWIVMSVLHWRRERRGWEATTLDGVAVELSPSTGPAVLGVLSQRIVLPTWATALAPEYRTLMLAHECEHIRARDPQRLALALGALVLMPWNLALWWCAARLRRAIELDCDARVLRAHPRTKAYGYLLLEVAAHGRNTGALAMPLVGLLRLPSELETRLRAMTRPRTIVRRTLLCAAAIAIGAIGVAFRAPVPSLGIVRAEVSAIRPLRAAMTRLIARATPAKSPSIVASARDTIPARTRDSIATLNRKLDSLAARLHEMQRVPTDSHITQFRIHTDRLEMQTNAERRNVMFVRTMKGPDDSELRRAQLGLEDRRAIDSVMRATYPDLIARPDSQTVVWFVSDSSGHILTTNRRGVGVHDTIRTDRLPPELEGMPPSQIKSVMIRKNSPVRDAGAVIWVRLKQ